jgi:hypothetical protein
MYLKMQRAENYENRLNFVRMELEQLLKPLDEYIVVIAFIQGLRQEFKIAAQPL